MKIYLVASTMPSWMNTGYGHSLLAADTPDLLVSFAEYIKDGNDKGLLVKTMTPTYEPKAKEPKP